MSSLFSGVWHRQWTQNFLPRSSRIKSSSGARPALPMGVTTEAIVESFSSIGSSILSSQLHYSCVNFIGCAISAPDGSSPRGYKGGGCLQPVIDSNISFGELFLFVIY
jgi:hypothetical protein